MQVDKPQYELSQTDFQHISRIDYNPGNWQHEPQDKMVGQPCSSSMNATVCTN